MRNLNWKHSKISISIPVSRFFKGIVPRLCEETFKRISKMKSDAESKIEYEVKMILITLLA